MRRTFMGVGGGFVVGVKLVDFNCLRKDMGRGRGRGDFACSIRSEGWGGGCWGIRVSDLSSKVSLR